MTSIKSLYVFDLDFTLWDAGGTWCDHCRPPFVNAAMGVQDADGALIQLYPQVIHILETLVKKGYPMALASRTGRPDWAMELLQLFRIDHFFAVKEIYPSSKLQHFSNIRNKTGIPYDSMIFFDDEHRNIQEVSRLGVDCRLVRQGLCWEHIDFHDKISSVF